MKDELKTVEDVLQWAEFVRFNADNTVAQWLKSDVDIAEYIVECVSIAEIVKRQAATEDQHLNSQHVHAREILFKAAQKNET